MSDKKFIDLSGEYEVQGVDVHDGPFSARLILTLNEKCSDFSRGYITYQSKAFNAEGIETYQGSIIANGNNFAMSFINILPEQKSDHGVIFGTVTHDYDAAGHRQTILHNIYYQPDYQGGGYGSAVSIKQ